MPPRHRIILSASRRTDLPGWHADRLASRLHHWLGRRGPEGLYGVVFWTRFPAALLAPPLRALVEQLIPAVAVNLTLTGRGRSRIEPHAPATADALAALPELVALLGSPVRLRWRFDPLLPDPGVARSEETLVATFSRLADVMARLGVPTCTFSFPAARSLRGDLLARYRRFEVPRWPNVEEKRRTVRRLVDIAGPRNIQLLCCSQPEVLEYHPAIQRAQCIPLEVLAQAHPPGTPPPGGKDRTQRRHCTCPPSQDIGDYREDVCRSGCLYCYSTLGGPDAGETLPWFLRGSRSQLTLTL